MGASDFAELKKQYERLDKGKEVFLDVHGHEIDYPLMWANEIKNAGGEMRRLYLLFPMPFAPLVSDALREVFPNIHPYSILHITSLTVRQVLSGVYVCDDGVYADITTGLYFYTVFLYFDAKRYNGDSLRARIINKVVERGRGAFINLTPSNSDVYGSTQSEEGDDGGSGAHDVGGAQINFHFPSRIFPFDDFLSHYPQQIQSALKRIMLLVENVCSAPNQRVHFSAVLAGVPGTGKSMFAGYAIEKALQLGATVIYANNPSGNELVKNTMEFALYTFPAVVFVFDEGDAVVVDREIMTTATLPYIVQLLDGYIIDERRASFGLIITTNRPHNIDAAFLRPVRLDEFVEFGALTDPTLAYNVFNAWCQKLGVVLPDGVQIKWFEGKTHAECAAVAMKLKRMQMLQPSLRAPITANTVKELLNEGSAWVNPKKIKGVGKGRSEGIGFGD